MTDVLKELYQEIYKIHWSFLELDDGLQKIEEKQVLEGLLKNFLCIVPHNRKFFLPETFKVFNRTVAHMKDFSIVKILNGFESISMYANNLFTKPWRKEYRTIKTYSGFFIHEIKSNLIDPEELFIAMGYKKAANHTLVLDGEICPDQVMNVSRDAMTAYVECKIMNKIYSELTSMKMACTWTDILNYREIHNGGVTDTVEAIRTATNQQQERCYTRENKPAIDTYYNNNVVQTDNVPMSISSSQCNGNGATNYCSQSCGVGQHQYNSPATIMQPHHYHHHYHNPAAEQLQQQQSVSGYYAPPLPPQGHCLLHPSAQPSPYDHQGKLPPPPLPPPPATLQQQYQHQHPSVCDYNTAHHPSLPHSKSLEHYDGKAHYMNQHRHSLESYDNYGRGGQYYEPSYVAPPAGSGGIDCLDTAAHPPAMMYNNHQQQLHPYNYSGNRYPLPYSISSQFSGNQQQPPPHPYSVTSNNGYQVAAPCYDHLAPKHCDSYGMHQMKPGHSNNGQLVDLESAYKMDLRNQHGLAHPMSSDDIDGAMYPSEDRRKAQTPRTSDFDSYEELFGDRQKLSLKSKPNKMKDGLGSFESWDYVYQSLDQGDQKRNGNAPAREIVEKQKKVPPIPPEKPSELRKGTSSRAGIEKARTLSRGEAVTAKSLASKIELNNRLLRQSEEVNHHMKSLSLGGSSSKPQAHHRQSSDSVGLRSRAAIAPVKKTTSAESSTIIQANEWSCRFCTFLNSESTRICEMCSKSKDFNPDPANTPTCV